MNTGKPDRQQTFLEYPDGQILPLPLVTATYNWNSMMNHLQNHVALKDNPENARRFIRTAIAYIFVFDIRSIVGFMFKYVTQKHDIALNIRQKKYEVVNFPDGEKFSQMEINLMLAQLLAVVENKLTLNSISNYTPDFKVLMNGITNRKQLAFFLSLVPNGIFRKVGEDKWHEILNAIADTKLLPAKYPEDFLYELSIGNASQPFIVQRLKKFALAAGPPPPLDVRGVFNYPSEYQGVIAPAPKSEPGAVGSLDHAADTAAQRLMGVSNLLNSSRDAEIDEYGLLGEAFETADDGPTQHKLYCDVERGLSDLPALPLGFLGAPLASGILPPIAAALALVPRPASPVPEAVFGCTYRVPTYSETLSPLMALDFEALGRESEPERDVFSNFDPPAVDNQTWVMQVSPSKLRPPARPKKRSRPAAQQDGDQA